MSRMPKILLPILYIMIAAKYLTMSRLYESYNNNKPPEPKPEPIPTLSTSTKYNSTSPLLILHIGPRKTAR